MPTIFHNIPRDGETVAAVRKGCTERGLAATCAERPCRRARRCRAPWRADGAGADLVLPPCLAARCEEAYGRLADAEVDLTRLRLIVAEARGVPNPGYVAEFADFDDAPWT
jgi:hypothetical protein